MFSVEGLGRDLAATEERGAGASIAMTTLERRRVPPPPSMSVSRIAGHCSATHTRTKCEAGPALFFWQRIHAHGDATRGKRDILKKKYDNINPRGKLGKK